MFKKIIQNKIEKGVIKYFERHPDVKLICVVGSVGKTTTKDAIATILDQKYKIGGSLGNHNSELSAPLGILGIKFPKNVKNPFAWLRVLAAVKKRIRQQETVDVIVQELGTDAPGQIAAFGRYLKPDITVLTAISEEHMEFFKAIEAVAEEEMTAINFSKQGVINFDDVDSKFSKFLTNANVVTYGSTKNAEYSLVAKTFSLENGYTAYFKTPNKQHKYDDLKINLYADHSLRAVSAAITVADQMGMTEAEIKQALAKIHPYNGRMNVLSGFRGVKIIDDSYNSSPLAVILALKTLQSINAPQRIAVLGSMNELGEVSEEAHQRVARSIDYRKVDWVITVGDEAEKYLASEARKNRCQVRSFKTSIEAGEFISQIMKTNAVLLFKGSQGGIYLEEAIKLIAPTSVENHLVRQTPEWLTRKYKFFKECNQNNQIEERKK